MTSDVSADSDRRPAADGGQAAAVQADLDGVRQHVVDLLAQLDRPPHTVRVQAGDVVVDITWAEQAGPGDNGRPAGRTEADTPRSGGAASPAVMSGSGVAGVGEYLLSPGVGVFYHAKEPDAEPFVSLGSVVQPGQQIGIIEAMKLMIPVEADRAGRIAEVVKGNGEPVEYAEPLFALEPEEAPDR